MTPLDVNLLAAAMLEEVLYAEKNVSGDDGSHILGNINIDSRDGDYLDRGNNDADDDVSQLCAMEAGGKGIGGNLLERATAVLFQYSDIDYNHLYNEDIDKDKKRIENSDSNKRVKVGHGRVNLIPDRPSLPNYDGMTAAKADDATKRYSIDRQKFREELCRERLRAAKGGLFDEKDYTGDVTPTLRPMAQVINSHLKMGHTFPDCKLIALHITEKANARGISFQTDKSDNMKLFCCGPNYFLVYATNSNYGWTVTRCNVLKESVEHLVGSPISIPRNVTPNIPQSPYKAAMIVPIIASTIAETPMASNKVLW